MGNGFLGDPGIVANPPTATPNEVPTPTLAQEQQAQSQYGLHSYSDGQSWLYKLFQGIFNQGSSTTDTLEPGTVQSLRSGLPTRSAPQPPSTNYAAMPHQQLYNSVTQGVDAGQIDSAASSWQQSSEDLIEASQNTASQALAGSEQSWQGQAGDAARRAVATLANHTGQAGQAAQVSAQLYKQQSSALSTAKNTVPPPPAHPFNAAAAQQQLMTVTNPAAFTTLANQDHTQYAAQQQAHQQAVTVVSSYDRVVAQTSQNQPGFAPAPPVAKPSGGSTGGGTSTGGTAGTHGGSGGGSAAPQLAAARLSGSNAGLTGHGSPTGSARSIPTPPTVGTPGQTSISDYTGGSGSSSPGNSPYGGGSSGSGGYGQSPTGQGANPAGSSDVGMISPVGGMPTGAGGGGADILRSGSGYGSGGFGPGGSSGLTGGTTGGPGGDGPGARSGAAPGAAAAEQSAIEGSAAGARGATGAGGAMPGGRRGKGGEDGEHQRASYLMEPDTDAIFGTDERTVKPVIGE